MSEIISKRVLVIAIIVIGVAIFAALKMFLSQPNSLKPNSTVGLSNSGSMQRANTEKPIKADTSQAIRPQQLYTPAPQLSQPIMPSLRSDNALLNRPQLASGISEPLRGYSVPELSFRNPINRNSLQMLPTEPIRFDPKYGR